ncbi:MAG TPA: hypothetical protein VF880_03395 [Actinomycetes bacterium]
MHPQEGGVLGGQAPQATAAGALDPDRFERAWAAGRRMPPARAVSFALAPLPHREPVAMLR